jgi:S1-C subfamily serine protease
MTTGDQGGTPAPRPVPHLTFRVAVVGLCALIVVNVALLGWLSWRTGDAALRPDEAQRAVPRVELKLPEQPAQTLPADLTAFEKRTIDVFHQSAPSVVFITTITLTTDAFHRDVLAIPAGTGSGFVWDNKGNIVTNFHVIREGNAARVTLDDHTTYNAKLVGHSADKDLAVLHIDVPDDKLRPLPRGSSSSLVVGQIALAIGNPFGLDHTLSTGVVSGLEREITSATGRPIFGVIQTDAAINPGNSGGPLLDSGGRLIGVNTAIVSPSGTSAGVGFAVPVDIVERIVPQLIDHGRVVRPGLGIGMDPQLNRATGIDGVLILNVSPGGAAEEAGLRPTTRDAESGRIVLGDVIVAVDGVPVHDQSDLFRRLDDKQVGDRVELTIKREGKEKRVSVELRALDD